MNNRKYMIMDIHSKSLVVDESGDPLRFVELQQALTGALDLPFNDKQEAFAVIDDLGNKWLWSAKGALRVAISNDAKDAVEEVENDLCDWEKITSCYTARVRPDGIVETQHKVRLADGPPIPISDWRFEDRMTTERWSDKKWIERRPLSEYIDHLPTKIHKLEQRAMNEKARSMRAAEKARQAAAAYEAGDEMTCQICARLICSKSGEIAHHGYTRPGDGWQSPSCDGARELPFEVSNAVLVAGIQSLDEYVVELKTQIEEVKEGRAPIVVSVQPHWSERRSYPYIFTITAQTYAAVAAGSEKRLDGSVPFENRRDRYSYELESRMRAVKASLGDMRRRNAGWKQTRIFVDGEFKPFVCEAA